MMFYKIDFTVTGVFYSTSLFYSRRMKCLNEALNLNLVFNDFLNDLKEDDSVNADSNKRDKHDDRSTSGSCSRTPSSQWAQGQEQGARAGAEQTELEHQQSTFSGAAPAAKSKSKRMSTSRWAAAVAIAVTQGAAKAAERRVGYSASTGERRAWRTATSRSSRLRAIHSSRHVIRYWQISFFHPNRTEHSKRRWQKGDFGTGQMRYRLVPNENDCLYSVVGNVFLISNMPTELCLIKQNLTL